MPTTNPERLTLSRPNCFAATSVYAPNEDGNGMIKGYAVVSVGEALGHGIWIDDTFLNQVVKIGNVRSRGYKTRCNHPSMCAPGFGTFLGRTSDFRRHPDQNKVIANFAGSKAADPDKLRHLFSMAENEPDMFGASIVFSPDYGEMKRFQIEHSDEKGKFRSPDPKNTNNYPHARLAELHASDFVDEPAANEDGLFSFANDESFRQHSEDLLDFIFGLRADPPESAAFFEGIDPARIRGFVRKYMQTHGIPTRKETQTMPQTPTQPDQPDLRADFAALRREFQDPAFVAEMFEGGKTIEEAKSIFMGREVERLSKENEALKAAASKPQDAEPVAASHEPAAPNPAETVQAFDAAAEKIAEERGIDLGEAYKLAAEKYPKLDVIQNF